MDWDRLRVFHAVAEAGSITQAGETLHLSQSAVSRQIQNLENAMGAILFHRHPRGLILTSEGEILHESTQVIVSQLNDVSLRLRDNREGVHGPLRITTTVDFGILWLIPRLKKFMALHPGLTIDLSMTEDILDLPMREADVAIRMRAPHQADVIAKPLWDSPVGLFASREYLAETSPPEAIEDLSDHPLIVFNPKAPQPSLDMDWLFRSPRISLRPKYIMSSQFAVLEAARQGLGIAILPEFLARQEPLIDRVATKVEGPTITPHLVYARELRDSKRVAVFKTFLEEELSKYKQ